MHNHVGWLWVVGIAGLLAVAANAQPPTPLTATTQFDGTYAFVSETKVTETYTTSQTEHPGRCPDKRAKSLVIAEGRAQLPKFEGSVGPQGDLLMRRHAEPVKWGSTPGRGATINGKIDSDGAVRARLIGGRCSYDLVWQKQTR